MHDTCVDKPPDGRHCQKVRETSTKWWKMVFLEFLHRHCIFPVSFHLGVLPDVAWQTYKLVWFLLQMIKWYVLLPIIRGKEDKWFTTVEANICKNTFLQVYIFYVREDIIKGGRKTKMTHFTFNCFNNQSLAV